MPKIRHERYQDVVDKIFNDILRNLEDVPRVNRLLRELTRIYDPLLTSRVVEPSRHRRIMELLRAGLSEEARALVEEQIALHNQFERLRQEREARGSAKIMPSESERG